MPKFPRGPMVRVVCRKELITKAVNSDSTKCWIAEAIHEAVPTAKNVAVDLATVRFSDFERGLRFVYLTPYAAQKALLAFDDGKPPAPFSFTLRNAHVTRAGGTEMGKESARRRVRKSRETAKLKRATLVAAVGGGSRIPRRVGGKRPPQLRTMRQFGIRAFWGASKARLEADAALTARADEL